MASVYLDTDRPPEEDTFGGKSQYRTSGKTAPQPWANDGY